MHSYGADAIRSESVAVAGASQDAGPGRLALSAAGWQSHEVRKQHGSAGPQWQIGRIGGESLPALVESGWVPVCCPFRKGRADSEQVNGP